MEQKTVGYILLGIGICIMLLATSELVLVFTGTTPPFPLFRLAQQSLSTSASSTQDSLSLLQGTQNPQNIQALLGPMMNSLIPQSTINETLNLSITFFLCTFLLNLGYKLSSLGVSMVRALQVKIKAKEIEVLPNQTTEVKT